MTALPADDETEGINAGVTFAMLRSTDGLAPGTDASAVLLQRFAHIERRLPEIRLPPATAESLRERLQALGRELRESQA